ncbi:MAG TPA: hypothetical protein VGM44_18285, partial [Polyangiaceae bacterium]|jgi:hypothetical protein
VVAFGASFAALGLATTIGLSKTAAVNSHAHAARAELSQVATHDATPRVAPTSTARKDESPPPAAPDPGTRTPSTIATSEQESAKTTAPAAPSVRAASATEAAHPRPILVSHVDHRAVAAASTAVGVAPSAAVKAAPRPLDLIAPY